ncbi:LuxR C-terminal-related transcriptional regulator [Sphingomonas oryzagri]
MATIDLPFHLLTETERICLRLVHVGLTSKQIAPQLNMRSDAVDRILRAARGKLNGLPRSEAARRLVEHEGTSGPANQGLFEAAAAAQQPRQSLGAPGLALAGDVGSASPDQADPPDDGPNDSPAPEAEALLDRASWKGLRSWLFGSDRSLRNDLETWSRIAAIAVIAAGAALIVEAALSLFIVLGRIAIGL